MASGEVSSKAVLKYEGNTVLASIRQLEKHTDLNRPPSNWLIDNLAGKFADLHKKKKNKFDRSSLLMANQYPDIIGEVDVVSAADHIKKLLKIPYSNNELSLTVNRLGKTLLLNEIDIPSFLQSYLHENGKELSWLQKLYSSAVGAPENAQFYPKKRNKEQSNLQKMLSKFLYYSVDDFENEGEPNLLTAGSIHNENIEGSQHSVPAEEFSRPHNLSVLPSKDVGSGRSDQQLVNVETSSSLNEEGAEGVQPSLCGRPYSGSGEFPGVDAGFQRDILWTFEDITMLVGSDLPIFGGGKYPTVSLRLRDSTKPINILTGIDYWLDNLMCNVPEIMMCYHSKGIVQKYEQIKTKDLPDLQGSSFSPKIVKDVAQNILSFLKANCTKEGHTYWLFKSNKDDVLKLYDLTSVCSQGQDSNFNPFTVSVGLLLYSIACNMYNSNEISKNNSHRMISLLQHSICLLEKEHQEYDTFRAHYLLLELLTTRFKDADEEEFTDQASDGDEETDEELSESSMMISTPVKTVDVETLCLPRSCKRKDSILLNDASMKIDEDNKNKVIITNAVAALKLLSNINDTKNLKCLPGIPGKFMESQGNGGNVVSHNSRKSDVSFPLEKVSESPNIEHIKCSLYQKIINAYLNLVNLNISKNKFGRSLRFLQIIGLCLLYLNKHAVEPVYSKCKAKMFFADISTMIAKQTLNIQVETSDFFAYNKNDSCLLSLLGEEMLQDLFMVENIEHVFKKSDGELLDLASDLYEDALGEATKEQSSEDEVKQVVHITRRLGNIRNELGVFNMNKAGSLAKGFGIPSEHEILMWKKGFTYFERSIEAFEVLQDWENIALVYSNTARLMRLCAQVYGSSSKVDMEDSRGEFAEQEKTCYFKAFEFYQKGLKILEVRNLPLTSKVNICYEMSATYYQMATLMQDYAPLQVMAEEKAVKEISQLLMKALHYSEQIYEGSNKEQKEMLTLRIGLVHQRLASLYHHVLRNQISDHGKRNYRSLSELHYKKVYDLMQPTSHPVPFLKYIVEHVALYDYLLKQSFSGKTLRSKLQLILRYPTDENKLLTSLQQLVNHLNSFEHEEADNYADENDISKIISLLEQQMLTCFKEVLKFLTNKKNKGFDIIDPKKVKRILEVALRGLLPTNENFKEKTAAAIKVLKNAQEIYGVEDNG